MGQYVLAKAARTLTGSTYSSASQYTFCRPPNSDEQLEFRMSATQMNPSEGGELTAAIIDCVSDVVVTENSVLETVLTGVLARGHVLLEDVPGTGKTLTALSIADALGLSFSRIQFTPDLLPNDITGTHVYNEHEGIFEFNEGPIFANVVLADEINRAPPKTQAALLEAMDENQVTVSGETKPLPDPFVVIATQNPIEQEGTFPLPEAQLDRFIVKTSLGYPDRDGELEILNLRENRTTRKPSVSAVTSPAEVLALRQVPERVRVDPSIKEYIVDIARATREHEYVSLGVSPRGIQRFYEAARARAVISHRDYVAPEDVKAIAVPIVQHRLVLTTEASIEGVSKPDLTRRIVDSVPVPSITGAD